MKRFCKCGTAILLCACLLFLGAVELVPVQAWAQQREVQTTAGATSAAETVQPAKEPVNPEIMLDTPVLKSIGSVDYQHIKLSWEAVEGADGYRIYRKTADTSWKRIASQKAVSYTDTVETGVLYYYTVRAYVKNKDKSLTLSGYQKSGLSARAVPAAPSVKAKAASWNSVEVSWESVEGADGYRVYRKTADGWKRTGTYKASVFSAKVGELNPGTSYTFTVRAYTKTDSGNVWGKYRTSGAKAKPVLSSPKLKKTKNDGDGVCIAWGGVAGAQGYRIYRKTTASDAKWKRIAEVEGKAHITYTDKKGKFNTEYYYTVRAYRTVESKLVLSGYNKKGVLGIRRETVNPDKPMIALTYDDGPSANTPVILDVLEKYDARATFFVVGDRVDGNSRYQSYVKRAVDLGCQIGNHTYEHKTLTSLSDKQIKSQISKCDAAVKKAAGVVPAIMRPPGGSRNSTVDQAVGKPLILWSIDTLDWKTRDSSQTISAVLDHIKDGDIVLMHDLYSATAEASKTIIPSLIKKGYQLVTVEELAAYRGGMKAGKRYSSFRP